MRKVKFAIMGLTLAAAGSAQAAGIGARIGTTGLGADVAWDLAPTLSARLGYSGGNVNHDVSTDITTTTASSSSRTSTPSLISPRSGRSSVSPAVSSSTRTSSTCSHDQVNGVNISGTVKPEKSAAPYLGIGYGRVSGTGVNFYADLGVMFQGTPQGHADRQLRLSPDGAVQHAPGPGRGGAGAARGQAEEREVLSGPQHRTHHRVLKRASKVQRNDARTLTRYNAWANELIFAAVAALPEGEAVKPRRSVFRNMVHTLNHNFVIDRIFQAHLEGRDHGYTARNTPDHPPLAELWRAQQELDQWYVAGA